MTKKLLSTCLLSTALLLGCGEVPEGDVEACEHLQEGPATPVTATTASTGAPAVSNDHKRYDITLVDASGGKGGAVSFAAGEAGDYILFLGADIPMKVTDSAGGAVSFEESTKSSTVCGEVKGRHVVPLEVGTYTLTFGPTTEPAVSLVIEEAAHEEGH